MRWWHTPTDDIMAVATRVFNSVFNLSSVLFGQSMWLDFLGQLSEPLKKIAAAANGGK